MTTIEAEIRLRTAELALRLAQRRHDACAVLPWPHNRGQAVRKSRIASLAADDLRRAEAEYRAAIASLPCTYCAEPAAHVEADGEAFCRGHWARECADADAYDREAPMPT